ncbi:hypothetical protein PV723_36905 [Streptomyces sp. AK04-3B]|nr:hypothetical protein [Streptomyces sp. AK04-3B]
MARRKPKTWRDIACSALTWIGMGVGGSVAGGFTRLLGSLPRDFLHTFVNAVVNAVVAAEVFAGSVVGAGGVAAVVVVAVIAVTHPPSRP